MKDFLAAWKIDVGDFPSSGSIEEKILFCIRYAILAPSTFNTQPWHFRLNENEVELYADRRYGLPVVDADDRALMISCGSALRIFELALGHFGLNSEIVELPDANDDDLVATIKITGSSNRSLLKKPDERLFEKITSRHGTRLVYEDKIVKGEHIQALRDAIESYGCWFHLCDEYQKGAILQLVSEADAIQASNKNFRRELASWVHPLRAESFDGMPHYNMRLRDVMGDLSPSIVRRFEVGRGEKAMAFQQMEEGTPVLAVLGSPFGLDKGRLLFGKAVVELGLVAEMYGVSLSSLNQVCEVPDLRLRVHDLIQCQGRAQSVMRIGYTKEKIYTPRRPLSSFVTLSGGRRIDANSANAANDEAASGDKGMSGYIE